jgi:hypothetical protein
VDRYASGPLAKDFRTVFFESTVDEAVHILAEDIKPEQRGEFSEFFYDNFVRAHKVYSETGKSKKDVFDLGEKASLRIAREIGKPYSSDLAVILAVDLSNLDLILNIGSLINGKPLPELEQMEGEG